MTIIEAKTASDPHRVLLTEMAAQRNAGELTVASVTTWHARLRQHTAGAIDDPDRIDVDLRELRRYLCTMAIDVRLPDLAQVLLAQSRPPDLRDPPRYDLPQANDDERVRWLNLRAMVLENIGALDAARDAYAEAGEAYAQLRDPEIGRFAVLTNAIQSAYELGDDRRGARLLAAAEEIARRFPMSQEIALDLASARLQALVFAGDVTGFTACLAEVRALAKSTQPAFLPAIARFASLAYLQMGELDLAFVQLPPEPAATAVPAELVPDTLLRLQLQVAAETLHPALVQRGLDLMGSPASVRDDWSLCGALAEALFLQGRIGAATLMATLFLRSLDSALETLPQRRGIADHKRRSILGIFEALQGALVGANYLKAAEDVAALHQSLLYGCTVPKGAYSGWAPSLALAAKADEARHIQAKARSGRISQTRFAEFVTHFELAEVPPSTLSRSAFATQDALQIGFLLDEGRVVRLVHYDDRCDAQAIEMPLGQLIDHVQSLHRAFRLDKDPTASRAALGEALFGPLANRIAAASSLEITPLGPVASLPFAALTVDGVTLGAGRAISIRTGAAPALAPETKADAKTAGVFLRVAFALGSQADALSAPALEAREIAEIHAHGDAILHEFNRASLLDMLAERPRLLHIGAHFRMNERNPAASELIGAGGEAIVLRSVFNRALDLSATELVFLAGCDSAGLSGMQSFASQLIALGARHVIAALWPVDDRATHALCVATHRALARGVAPPEALTRARDHLQAGPCYAAPHHWAAFQCYSG